MGNNINVQAGDIFLTSGSMIMGQMIRGMEGFQRKDHFSVKYAHAGIILDSTGKTLEALTTVRSQNIFEAYTGEKVMIARYKVMHPAKFDHGYDCIKKHIGDWYPYQRLFAYVVGVADNIHQQRYVCSELTAKFLHEICKWDRFFDFEHYFGITPDRLMEIIKENPDRFEIVFEGKI